MFSTVEPASGVLLTCPRLLSPSAALEVRGWRLQVRCHPPVPRSRDEDPLWYFPFHESSELTPLLAPGLVSLDLHDPFVVQQKVEVQYSRVLGNYHFGEFFSNLWESHHRPPCTPESSGFTPPFLEQWLETTVIPEHLHGPSLQETHGAFL